MSRAFQFAVVRFVPNVVRDEGVNIGVIVRAVEGTEFGYRFLRRTSTLRKLLPEVDHQLVAHFERQLRLLKTEDDSGASSSLGLVGNPKDASFFSHARAEFNGNLQLMAPQAYLTATLDEAMEHAFAVYVASPAVANRPINYQVMAPYHVRQRLWTAFQRRELIRPGLVQREFVQYGRHASWTFDLGYQNGNLNLISSIAMTADTPSANLGRALVFKGMIEDVRQREKSEVHGTAVVQTGAMTDVSSGVKTAEALLKGATIDVVAIGDLEELADRVQADLAVHAVGGQ